MRGQLQLFKLCGIESTEWIVWKWPGWIRRINGEDDFGELLR